MSNAWFHWTKALEGDDYSEGFEFEHEGEDSQKSTVYSDVDEDLYTNNTKSTNRTRESGSTKQTPASERTRDSGTTARSTPRAGDTATTDSLEKPELKNLEAGGGWSCRLYKHEKLQQEMDGARISGQSPREAILATLKAMGVTVFIVSFGANGDVADVVASVRRIVRIVAQENRLRPQFNCRVFQRCLLFQDHQGRLFNLVVVPHAVGPASDFHSVLDSFSGWQAMVGLTILVRSLKCASEPQTIGNLQPTYLTLIFGLILGQEISLSWLNTAMLVRAMPSISGYALIMNIGSDWLRKGALLAFTLASTTSNGRWQQGLILLGLSLSCLILLANLGSRAWYFLKWRPFSYNGPLASVAAYLLAVGAGLLVPYMGYREVEAGGKAALESILTSAVIVAAIFVFSAFAEVKRFIVLGSETCEQEGVDFVVGIWWSLTLIIAIFQARRIKIPDQFPKDEEPILVQDDKSPVGYRVPNLPDFAIDPGLAKDGSSVCTLALETMFGLIMAFVVGGVIVWLAITKRVDKLSFSGVF